MITLSYPVKKSINVFLILIFKKIDNSRQRVMSANERNNRA